MDSEEIDRLLLRLELLAKLHRLKDLTEELLAERADPTLPVFLRLQAE